MARSPSLLLVLQLPLALAAAPAPAPLSFCELTAHASRYEGRQVTFRAEFGTDGIERSVLMDDRCAGRKGIGLGRAPEDVAYRLFGPIRHANVAQIPQPRIFATFIGTVVREKPSEFEFHNDDGFRIDLVGVSRIRSKPIPRRSN